MRSAQTVIKHDYKRSEGHPAHPWFTSGLIYRADGHRLALHPPMFTSYRSESTFEEIPIMFIIPSADQTYADHPFLSPRDLKDATSPDLNIRRALAARIRDACINIGFFYGSALPLTRSVLPHPFLSSPVSNHGIPESVIEQTLVAAKEFFALPLSAKEEVVKSSPPLRANRPCSSISTRAQTSRGTQDFWERTPTPRIEEISMKVSTLVGRIQ